MNTRTDRQTWAILQMLSHLNIIQFGSKSILFQVKSHESSRPCSIYKSHVDSLKRMNFSIQSWEENQDKNIQQILDLHKTEDNQILNITYNVYKVTSDLISNEENIELVKSGKMSRNG